MRTFIRSMPVGITLAISSPAFADVVAHPPLPSPVPAVGSGSILQIIFSLLLVLAAIVLVAWLLKRMNVTRQGPGNLLKVIGGVAVGQRERVVLVEIENTWLVVGVGPGQIRTLHTMQKSDHVDTGTPIAAQAIPFNAWLKKFIEKRDAA
ncbi:MAG: Flagellar biosynthetic protein FliO [Candidatus Gallionella acididurans]|uniref:Flagellar protein n=1 Tax=Candidatus Gallionella acididurans TaxID=1796491 RepID=A0A139BYA2_9PROT|nr:MAG: Flagellar biosynthetic protein FliO [Candidatus Gallionella acididurans]